MGEMNRSMMVGNERVCVNNCASNDAVEHPQHYTDGKIEVIEFIQDKHLNFCRGNAIKYICRAGKKDKNKEIEDLEKAIQYLKFEIADIERRHS